ncbi:S41 family peptidase [Chryseobacterium sp. MEBOG06]|uniref:S41 family peptidase n=1 Tax=Chryseobacterium sp. MEBOG06 TaxID=2879938 RepID=UPI001F312081|nr:S41 family peptidase [Chryseobacterium sp. MEBOG06]UKB82227.1 S41 family peptidase [Chryseobacterium sp. MEBOG06]
MKLLYTIIICFLFCNQHINAQDNPKKYVADAILLMKHHSVNKGKINWDAVTVEAMNAIKGKKTNKEAYPVIVNSIKSLEDHHSGFYPPEMVQSYMKTYKESGLEFPFPKDSLINGDLGYITIPAIGNLNNDDWNLYVRDFYEKIKLLDTHQLQAWIIDLRENDGGMFSPMFRAIEPFLDQQNVVGSKDNEGKVGYYKYKDKNILFDNTIIATINVEKIKLKNKDIPVFVLVSKKTASSGEFVTAALAGQKNVRIIGANTQGLTSDNSEFRLLDGAILKLTTGILINRKGEEYREIGKGITPDIITKTNNLSYYIDAVKSALN